MKISEHKFLETEIEASLPVFRLDNIKNRADRTLLYGYDIDGYTHHLYLEDNVMVLVVYGFPNVRLALLIYDDQEIINPVNVIPNKRLYPEACDFEFCQELKLLGVYLPFTTFNPDRPENQLYGLRLKELAHPMEGM